MCDSVTVWNVPVYGQAELIASIVFACHSLSVWGNNSSELFMLCYMFKKQHTHVYQLHVTFPIIGGVRYSGNSSTVRLRWLEVNDLQCVCCHYGFI